MKHWTTAVPDWESRIVDRRSLIPVEPLFQEEADAALAVFKSLRVVDQPGRPTFGEISEPWVLEFVAAIFGSYDAARAERLIKQAFILISKKNGKSTIAAGIMLTALIRNWRHSAELLILAPTIEVANNAYDPCAAMVRADPELSSLLHLKDHVKEIRHRITGAKLKVIAADRETVSGKKSSFVFIDELWLFGSRANADAMIMEATGGLVARPEGFVIYASTHADEPAAGVFKSKMNYFRRVRDGEISDPKSLPLLFEWPRSMLESKEYLDPKNWYITNPNIGKAVSSEWIADKIREEELKGSDSLKKFYAKHLNVEIGMSDGSDRWRGADYWEGARLDGLTLDEIIDRSDVLTMGIDGGGLDDLFPAVVLGRDKNSGEWLHWAKAWVHDDVLKLRKDISERLRDFEADGDLSICQRPTQDIEEITALAVRIFKTGLLPEKHGIGVDPYAITALLNALEGAGIPSDVITGIKQGAALSPAYWTIERKLKDGTFWHCGQALMAWCIGNAKTEQRGNAMLITKQTAGKAKIDPLVATANASFLMALNPEAGARSVYETRGIRAI